MLQTADGGDRLLAALSDFFGFLPVLCGTRISFGVGRGRRDRLNRVPGFAGDALRRGIVDTPVTSCGGAPVSFEGGGTAKACGLGASQLLL
ncbi:hypothetical protein [Streptomyces sp. NPDC059916]|uniref:hypothetical protein n=1 Tax=Streptomyces sp. NPDC059916 TaxID=3347001 RepID=UPI00369AEEB8